MNQERNSLTWHTYSDHLRSMMKELMTTDEFADVTLVTDDKQHIKVHKNILSLCSPVFRDMLQKDRNSNPIIFLRGVHFSEIESIMQYIYLGEATFNMERMDEFLAVAKSLEIKELCNAGETTNELDDGPSTSGPEISSEKLEDKNLTSNNIGEICNINSIYNIYPDGDSKPSPQNLSQADKCLASTAVTEPTGQVKQESKRAPLLVDVNTLCKLCDKAYSSTWALKEHNQSAHQGVKYGCDHCKYKSTSQGNLRKHILSKHEGAKYSCDQCDYVSSWKQGLCLHKTRIH